MHTRLLLCLLLALEMTASVVHAAETGQDPTTAAGLRAFVTSLPYTGQKPALTGFSPAAPAKFPTHPGEQRRA